MSVKISFLPQFQPFLITSIKTVAYLMHHLSCHNWSKFQTQLTTFQGFLAKRPPKCSLKRQVPIKGRAHPKKNIKKCLKFIKILVLISLKSSLQNVVRLQILLVFSNIFTANILGMQEKRRGFTSHAGQLLLIKPVSQYI